MCGERIRSVSWQEIAPAVQDRDPGPQPLASFQPSPDKATAPASTLLDENGLRRPGQFRLYVALALLLVALVFLYGHTQLNVRAWIASLVTKNSPARAVLARSTEVSPPQSASAIESSPQPPYPSSSSHSRSARTSAPMQLLIASEPANNASATPPVLGQYLAEQGEKYLYGNGVPQDCSLAMKDLAGAAGRQNPHAQILLGTMFATGHCASRDLPTAYRWFARALGGDPKNHRLEQNLEMIWNQMTPGEKQTALQK